MTFVKNPKSRNKERNWKQDQEFQKSKRANKRNAPNKRELWREASE